MEGSLAPKRAKAPASLAEESEAFFFKCQEHELALEKVVSDRQGTTT